MNSTQWRFCPRKSTDGDKCRRPEGHDGHHYAPYISRGTATVHRAIWNDDAGYNATGSP